MLYTQIQSFIFCKIRRAGHQKNMPAMLSQVWIALDARMRSKGPSSSLPAGLLTSQTWEKAERSTSQVPNVVLMLHIRRVQWKGHVCSEAPAQD